MHRGMTDVCLDITITPMRTGTMHSTLLQFFFFFFLFWCIISAATLAVYQQVSLLFIYLIRKFLLRLYLLQGRRNKDSIIRMNRSCTEATCRSKTKLSHEKLTAKSNFAMHSLKKLESGTSRTKCFINLAQRCLWDTNWCRAVHINQLRRKTCL